MTLPTQTLDSEQPEAAQPPETGRRRGVVTAILLLALAGVIALAITTQLPLVSAVGSCGGG